MLKAISVVLLMLGYSGVAVDFLMNYHKQNLCIAMILFATAMYFLFY